MSEQSYSCLCNQMKLNKNVQVKFQERTRSIKIAQALVVQTCQYIAQALAVRRISSFGDTIKISLECSDCT